MLRLQHAFINCSHYIIKRSKKRTQNLRSLFRPLYSNIHFHARGTFTSIPSSLSSASLLFVITMQFALVRRFLSLANTPKFSFPTCYYPRFCSGMSCQTIYSSIFSSSSLSRFIKSRIFSPGKYDSQ